jgi:integrase
MPSITDREIAGVIRQAKATNTDVWVTDSTKARGIGRLRIRARPTGQCLFYFRYADATGKQDAIAIGVYDPSGKTGLTLRKAREKAGEWSKLYQEGRRDLRVYLEHKEAEDRAARESAARARVEAERRAKTGTLRALFEGYVAHLERQGKKGAARDAHNAFRLNVVEEWPHLAEMCASAITHEDVSKILAVLITAGKGRTAGKLRSYLRAAYGAALQAASDPTIHSSLHGFELTANPAAAVPAKPLARFNVARDRSLNITELRAFMKAIDSLPAGLNRDMLWLCLLLGGQRPAQLLRAKPTDVDMDDRVITLFDAKGARKQPRAHRIPLTARAAEIVQRYVARAFEGETLPYLFTNNGRVPVRVETLSGVVAEISSSLVDKKTTRGPFQFRDIRRTCETMLASMGISRDVRAQILSHGLGGVQDRHYDRHDYMDEKRRALEGWDARLIDVAKGTHRPNVIPMKRR